MGRNCDCWQGNEVEALIKDLAATVGLPEVLIHLCNSGGGGGGVGSVEEVGYGEVREVMEESVLSLAYLIRSLLPPWLILLSARGWRATSSLAVLVVHSSLAQGQPAPHPHPIHPPPLPPPPLIPRTLPHPHIPASSSLARPTLLVYLPSPPARPHSIARCRMGQRWQSSAADYARCSSPLLPPRISPTHPTPTGVLPWPVCLRGL
jgi:hypothetical protein